MANRSEITPAEAFRAWYEMGTSRSVNGVWVKLKDSGIAIGRKTLNKWHDDYEWPKKALDVDAGADLEAEEMADQVVQLAAAAEDVVAAIADDPIVPFSTHEKIESTADTLAALASAFAQTAITHVARYNSPNVSLELIELLQLAKATAGLTTTVAQLHTALNPQPKGKAAVQERDPKTGALIGEVLPLQNASPFADPGALLEALANPPRLSGKL